MWAWTELVSWDRYILRSIKVSLHFSSQLKCVDFPRILKKGKLLSANLEMNLDKAVTQPTNRCTACKFRREYMSYITLNFSELASIPFSVIELRNFRLLTPNVHLLGLNFNLCFCLKDFCQVEDEASN